MPFPLLNISLPIADRRRAMDFYSAVLDVGPLGSRSPSDDGVPEPLRFQLNAYTTLMLIPTGGFGWVLGDRGIAPPGVSECLLGMPVTAENDVDLMMERFQRAGGEAIAHAGHQPWGYSGVCADLDGHAWQITTVSGL